MPRWKPGQYSEPPDNFDPENPYADPIALVEAREHSVRQKTIKIERAKARPSLQHAAVNEIGLPALQHCCAPGLSGQRASLGRSVCNLRRLGKGLVCQVAQSTSSGQAELCVLTKKNAPQPQELE